MHTQSGNASSYRKKHRQNWNISEILCLHLPSNIAGAHSAFPKALLSSLSPPQPHQLQNLPSPNLTRYTEDIQAVRVAYRETAGSASVCPRLIGPLDVEETGFIPSTYCILQGSSPPSTRNESKYLISTSCKLSNPEPNLWTSGWGPRKWIVPKWPPVMIG